MINREYYDLNLSPNQERLFRLYKKAYSQVIIWQKTDKKGNVRTRLLDPSEVIII